jgi:DNA-binding LacI/PurR family transcriptional regulator
VLRGGSEVSPATRHRVEAVIRTTGYRVNAIAQSLRSQRVNTIAHILHEFWPNPFFSHVARGLQREAASYGYEVLAYNCEGSAQLESEAVDAAIRHRVRAVVFTTPVSVNNVRLVINAGIRVVQVERPTPVPTAVVTVNNYVGARDAMEHLIACGHDDIVYIGQRARHDGPHGSSVDADRLRAYRDAVATAGLKPRVVLKSYPLAGREDFSELGQDCMKALLSAPKVPTAVFTGSDLLAAGILQALYEAGCRVPDDMAVVGFDDTYAAALCPPLTTVAVPMYQLGQEAFRSAVVYEERDAVELPTHLVVRASTGKVSSTSPNGKRPESGAEKYRVAFRKHTASQVVPGNTRSDGGLASVRPPRRTRS